MSLLLDALQRASKDKEKAAAAADTAISPAHLTPLEMSPGPTAEPAAADYPNLTQPLAPTPKSALSAPPIPVYEMELTLEMPKAPAPSEPPPPPEPRHEPKLDPIPAPAPKQEVAPPDPAPATRRSADVAGPTPTAPSPAPAVEQPPVKPVVVPADRAAQEIRRAYASQKPQPVSRGRRVLAWGVLVGLLALAVASVVFGMWGDPSTLLRLVQPSSVAPAFPPPVVIPAALPPAIAPSVPAPATEVIAPMGASSAPKGSDMPAPTSTLPPVPSPAKTATRSRTAQAPRGPGREGLAPPPAKPTFAAKAGEPNSLELGYAALIGGRFEEATLAYERSLRANPDERDALLGLAYINHQQGRMDDARSYYRKVLRNDPGNANANSGLLSLEQDGDATRTAGRARDLASRRPDSAAAMAAAGSAFVRDGLLADAAVAFARAQTLEPGNPLHAYNHAVALDRLGQLQQAIEQYERALSLPLGPGAAERSYPVDAVRVRIKQLRRALDKQNGQEE